MKKVALLLGLCAFLLCGCNTIDSSIDSTIDAAVDSTVEENYSEIYSDESEVTSKDETNIVGLWKHTEYPNAYSITVDSLEGTNMSITMQAARANYAQLAIAGADDVYFENNKAKFAYEDTFNNTGICEIEIIGDEMTVTYKTNTPYKGGWCVDAGAGTYKKSQSASSDN